MRFIERTLAEHRDARWTVVMLHQPFWDTPGEHADWDRVEAWLGDRPYTVLAGHFHRYVQQIRHGREYITLGTTGGGSRLRGIDRGEFDHVMLVTMRADGPVIANLMLDGIHGADVHTLAMRNLMYALDHAVTTEPQRVVSERFSEGEQRFTLANERRPPDHGARPLPGRRALQRVAGRGRAHARAGREGDGGGEAARGGAGARREAARPASRTGRSRRRAINIRCERRARAG